MDVISMKDFGSRNNFFIDRKDKPTPNRHEVRIRIVAAGFNPVDWKIRCNWYGGKPNQILGFDCSGIVEEVGTKIKRFSCGDEVYAMSIGGSNGSYAQYSCVPEELVAKKPKNISFNEAASIPLAAMTAYRATIVSRAVKEHDVVFVAGAGGGVGSFALQLLRHAKVKDIYTIARDEKSASFLVENLGLKRENIVLYENLAIEELKEQLLGKNNGRFFDATFDFVGGERKRLCLELTNYSGHFSTVLPEEKFDYPFWGENDIPRARNISVHQVNIGAELGSKYKESMQVYVKHLQELTSLLETGVINPPSVNVVGPFSVDTVKEGHRLLEECTVKGKLVMEVMDRGDLERVMESRCI